MRIALVHSFYPGRMPSGENAVVLAEADALRQAGHDVALLGVDADDVQKSTRLYPVRAAGWVASGGGMRPDADIRAFAPDVVHIHNLFPNISTRWIEDCEAPVVQTLHNYRLLCPAGTFYRDGEECYECLLRQRSLAPSVIHGCYRGSRIASAPFVINRLLTGLPSQTRDVDHVVALNAHMAGLLRVHGVSGERISVWPNFVPASMVGAAPAAVHERAGFLFLGRLEQEKGVVELLQHWPAAEQLTIAGTGRLHELVAQAASERANVTFLQAVDPDRVPELLGRAIGLVVPSRWLEGFPRIYLEALAAGTPVIASPRNVLGEIVAVDGSGIRCEPVELQRGIDLIRARFSDYQARGQEVMHEKYSQAAHVQRAEDLYGRLSATV